MTAVVHDFKTQLAYSELDEDEVFWDAVYRRAFLGLVNHMSCLGDVDSQRMGIDRLIFLSSGKVVTIDEKKRATVYNDILLEYTSVDTTGAPGWMEKNLMIDYLAYAFMPTQECYLFPWPLLQRAWYRYKRYWISTYPIKTAQNGDYCTYSVAVPIKVVRQAVSTAGIIALGPRGDA